MFSEKNDVQYLFSPLYVWILIYYLYFFTNPVRPKYRKTYWKKNSTTQMLLYDAFGTENEVFLEMLCFCKILGTCCNIATLGFRGSRISCIWTYLYSHISLVTQYCLANLLYSLIIILKGMHAALNLTTHPKLLNIHTCSRALPSPSIPNHNIWNKT